MALPDLDGALTALKTDPKDESAWRNLYLGAHPYVFALAFRATGGDSQTADEVAQDVFVRLARYLPFSSLADSGALLAYMRVMSRRVLHDRWDTARRRGKPLDLAALGYIAARETDYGELDARELLGRLQGEQNSLSSPDRTLLNLLLDGADPEEIGEVVGGSPPAIRVRIHRLRKRLWALLRERRGPGTGGV